ncbi:AAA family ATPase [Persicirhabdus sediminis]|uniref:AAA family ATPase n=1 Tax=Persicirhabdus sediminis TaxID=454144 RepID=A0A8J7MBM7_9BACT|nr:AAA family ATPase [Persicirhabdus sediminis]MBK1790472.1 AAA family ATPase [Persicirhabdus sediminis]
MSDDDKEKREQEELQKTLKDLFGQLGEAGPIPFASFPMGGESKVQASDDEPETMEFDSADSIFDFSYKPRDIKAHLDRYVIRQDEAKKALSIAVCDHYNHAKRLRVLSQQGEDTQNYEYQKQNVIVVGPTGVGKTYLIKHIAELIGVPFVKADATKFSETGYVGGDVDDLVRELVQRADGNVELAEYGIIYIDEIDKLAGKSSMGRDVSGRGVQTTLLKLMEETEVPARAPNDMKGQMMAMMDMQSGKAKQKDNINTRHILFIVSGAFSGLEKVVQQRLRSGQIGFGANHQQQLIDEEVFNHVSTQDFIDYGFEAEFIGRLPVRVLCENLEAKDFVNIMKNSEGSLLRQYEREFEAYGIRANFADSAIAKMAELAEGENTGARALMTVGERILRPFKFELPGTAVSELVIDRELIDSPAEVLERYRELGKCVDVEKIRDEVEIYAREFSQKYGVTLDFTEASLTELAVLSNEQARSPLQICEDLFKDYQYGLKLIQKNTTQKHFEIGAQAIRDADGYLSKLVVESYGRTQTSEPASEAE